MDEFELSSISDEEIELMSLDGLGMYILDYINANITTGWQISTILSTLTYRTDYNGNRVQRSLPAQQAIAEAISRLLNNEFLSRNRPPGFGSGHGADSVFITRAGEKLLNDTELGIRSSTAAGLLGNLKHLELRDARSRFLDGQYSNSVFEAMRSIERRVRTLAKQDRRISGVPLMRSSFGAEGPLTDPAQDKGWSDGMRDLFAGAFGVYRNDTAHARNEEAYQDPEEVARVILLVDLMHSHLDRIEQRFSTPSTET